MVYFSSLFHTILLFVFQEVTFLFLVQLLSFWCDVTPKSTTKKSYQKELYIYRYLYIYIDIQIYIDIDSPL